MTRLNIWIPDCDSHSPALLDLFLSSDASICTTMALTPLGNSDHVVVSVSIDFPSYSQRDAPFHRIVCDYSPADWDGLRDHLRDVPCENIFKLSAFAAASEFCMEGQVGIDVYIPRRKYQILRNSEPELSDILTELFNKSLKESSFSDCWKVLLVVTVFKNVGERTTAKTTTLLVFF